MAKVFVLRRRESLAEAFCRIADGQLVRAAAALSAAELPRERRVHEVRQRFEESRALIRLFRGTLDDAFAELSGWVRDAGHSLAEYRDATAAVGAVDALPAELRRDVGRRSMRALRSLVRNRRDALYADAATVDLKLSEMLGTFPAERLRIGQLRLSGGARAVEKGFAKTLGAARKAMAEAFETGRDLAFHWWRKRTKDHWYHVQLFVPVWPELMRAREKALDRLSHLLGDHHDLAVVGGIVAGSPDTFGGADEVRRIAGALAARQKAIVAEARPLAERLYAVKPRDLAGETMALWRAWHRG